MENPEIDSLLFISLMIPCSTNIYFVGISISSGVVIEGRIREGGGGIYPDKNMVYKRS